MAMRSWDTRSKWVVALLVVASSGALMWKFYPRPLAVKVISVKNPLTVEPSGELSTAAQPLRLRPLELGSRAAANVATSATPKAEAKGTRAVSGGAFVGKLRERMTLSDAETQHLKDMLTLAGNIQSGIDAEPSPQTREELQLRLFKQVELRLRLILRDDERVNQATSELRDVSRIELGG